MIPTASCWRKGKLFSVELHQDLKTAASGLAKATISSFKKYLVSVWQKESNQIFAE